MIRQFGMLPSSVFFLCFLLWQVDGSPQQVNLAWINPSSMMKMQIQPNPSSVASPESSGLPSFPPQHQKLLPYNYIPSVEEVVALQEAYFLDEPKEYRLQTDKKCNPRSWWERMSCLNATTIRRCTARGDYKYSNCHSGWRCVNGVGRCLRRLPNSDFSCPDYPGVYPDPHNCRVYHICDASKGDTEVSCYAHQVYDPLTQSCQRRTADRPCYRFRCQGGSGNVAYPGDANIYGTCSHHNQVESVTRCALGYGWNNNNQSCETPYCRKEGNIGNPKNSSQYYVCSRIKNELIMSEVFNCTGTTVFNTTYGICTPPLSLEELGNINLIENYESGTDESEEAFKGSLMNGEGLDDDQLFPDRRVMGANPWGNFFPSTYGGAPQGLSPASYYQLPQDFPFNRRVLPYL